MVGIILKWKRVSELYFYEVYIIKKNNISNIVICRNDLLFNDDNVVAYRSDLKSLIPQTYLTAAVINAWTCHLNYQERLRSQDSPRRFFFSTFPCVSFQKYYLEIFV